MLDSKEFIIKRNNDFYLDSYDYQVLLMLYKPLVGPLTIDFYLSLYQMSYGEKNLVTSRVNLDEFVSDYKLTPSDIDTRLSRLERIKLVRISKDAVELFPNYTAEEYFESPFASNLKLISTPHQLNVLMNRFLGKTINIPNVKDPNDINLYNLSKLVTYKIRRNDRVPFSFDELVNAQEVYDKKELLAYRNEFESISALYHFQNNKMHSILYQLNESDKFDINEYIKLAQSEYMKNIKAKEEPEIDHVLYFSSHTAEELLVNRDINVSSISKADKSTLERLRNEKCVEEGFISLLVGYSLATNNKKMHAYQFYEKIVDDWKSKNITTVKEAYDHISDLYSKGNKKINSQISSEDWFNSMWDKIKEESK